MHATYVIFGMGCFFPWDIWYAYGVPLFLGHLVAMGCFFLGYLVGVPFFLGYLVWGACFPRIFGMGCLFS